MKINLPELKHTEGKLHFYLKILKMLYQHEIVEKEHQNYKTSNDQFLFFQHNQFSLPFLVQKLHSFYLIISRLKNFLSSTYFDFFSFSNSFLSSISLANAAFNGSFF